MRAAISRSSGVAWVVERAEVAVRKQTGWPVSASRQRKFGPLWLADRLRCSDGGASGVCCRCARDGVNGQELGLVMPRGAADLTQGDLQSLGIIYAVGAQQLMYGLIGGHKRDALANSNPFWESVRFRRKPVVHSAASWTNWSASRGSMRALSCSVQPQSRSQVPNRKCFRDQQPKAHQITIDLIGQKLSDAAFDTGGIGRLGFRTLLGALGLDGRLSAGTIAIEFFFAGQTVR